MHPTPVCTWKRSLRRGDIVVLRLSVGITALHITIQVLRTGGMKASFVLPHRVAVVSKSLDNYLVGCVLNCIHKHSPYLQSLVYRSVHTYIHIYIYIIW